MSSSTDCGDRTPPAKRPRTATRCLQKDLLKWSAKDVQVFLNDHGLERVAAKMNEHGVTGLELATLSSQDMAQMEISDVDQLKVFQLREEDRRKAAVEGVKIFNDSVHGHIELHPLLVKIIDTPQFQRLRHIKQLGGTYYVYPGASNNRFEHSIGVAHLAGRLIDSLDQRQPELEITDEDKLCVRIAGLCHDLGHGPFSHLFDSLFIPTARPGCDWKHEKGSVEMLDYLIDSNHLKKEFQRFGLEDKDLDFIKEMIVGPAESELCSQGPGNWPYCGRPVEKSFLYEIVANKKNGIDVDKWDYFARDCHHLGIRSNFDHLRFMAFARVIQIKERREICCRDKEVSNLYDMFYVRMTLHRRAYQHKTSNAIEHMIKDALYLADEFIEIPGTKGGKKSISGSIDDVEAFSKLNDSILSLIAMSDNPDLKPAQEMIKRIEKRQLYKYIGQTAPIDENKVKYSKSQGSQIVEDILAAGGNECKLLEPKDLLVDIVTFDYGSGKHNPIDKMKFYSKSDPDKPVSLKREHVSHMLPSLFSEQHVRLYCKKLDKKCFNVAWKCFQNWCQSKDYGVEDLNDDDDDGYPGSTPYTTPFGTPSSRQKNNSSEVPSPQSASVPIPSDVSEVAKKLSFHFKPL